MERPPVGTISWFDLTVDDAEGLRDFYRQVVGWSVSDVDMGDYRDFTMTLTDQGDPVAGVCHARGMNTGIPPQWMMYITVADIARSIKSCEECGGKVVAGPKSIDSYGRFCVIQDPAGAVCALFEPAPEPAE